MMVTNKFTPFILVLFSAILFSACNKKCPQQQEIFSTKNVHSYVVPPDSISSLKALLDHMDYIYCISDPDRDWPLIYIDTKKDIITTESPKALRIGIEPTPCTPFEYDLAQILEVIKDGENYLVEGERIPRDSISEMVIRHYMNYGKDPKLATSPKDAGIWIIALEKESTQSLIPVLKEVTSGFEVVANEYALNRFTKPICKLNESQYKQLRSELPFHLAFKTLDTPLSIDINW